MNPKIALAIAAHPDDIEFQMSGTLLLLQAAGWETHYVNLSSGNGGSMEWDSATTAETRAREARESAAILGARWHPPIAHDMEVFYNEPLLRKTTALVREVKPSIVLTQPLSDYMEDHMNTARLAVSATFARGVRNFVSDPPRDPCFQDAMVYHCMPHSGRDPMRRVVAAGAWVNVSGVLERSLEALGAHRSQRDWLEATQGANSFFEGRLRLTRALGEQSRVFSHAEGWRRHSHVGFANEDSDPLATALGADYLRNDVYEAGLESPETAWG